MTTIKLSPLQRPLCVAGRLEERKIEHMGNDGKREERPIPYNVQFSGQICGSVVLAKPADYLNVFECYCEDNSIKGSIRNLMGFPFCSFMFGVVNCSSLHLGGEN